MQYQKQLRLGGSPAPCCPEGYDVTQAAMAVGYESATRSLSREYKRLFGDPPRRNVASMKNIAKGAAMGGHVSCGDSLAFELKLPLKKEISVLIEL